MKVEYVDLCGFRGYRNRLRIDFGESFTIIDGRNGVGKSTIFDAIEFSLTGKLSKYRDAKASGETVADYIWWTGSGPQPKDRYVEVGFRADEESIKVRRSQFETPPDEVLSNLVGRLTDLALAPMSPLSQLCTTSIIRDEHIAELSLDLKEADRYALLRDALGANDADTWIARAASLLAAAKKRTAVAEQEVASVNAEAATTARRIDEISSSIVDEEVLAGSVARLRDSVAGSSIPTDQLAGPTRARIAEISRQLEIGQGLQSRWDSHLREQERLSIAEFAVFDAEQTFLEAARSLEQFELPKPEATASSLATKARQLVSLVAAGRSLGLQNDACPLCATEQTADHFEHGLQAIERLASEIDAEAAEQAKKEEERQAAVRKRDEAAEVVQNAKSNLAYLEQAKDEFETDLGTLGLLPDATRDAVSQRLEDLRREIDQLQRDLRVVGTVRFVGDLERTRRVEADIRSRAARAQERYSRARRAENIAQSLHDAARRAAAESLDRRLDRVLPLMSELYKRLRPHPVWRDIEYSIRGDVRRFLKLQVGDALNPQFLFSSGQRRATGLAFLLSVNASLAWSRWQSIMLDDPVQHVDDFRTVHLAELLAQFVADGRQIICAVEDAALADLLCRRLPVMQPGQASRVTLGTDRDGMSTKLHERTLPPLPKRALLVKQENSAAS